MPNEQQQPPEPGKAPNADDQLAHPPQTPVDPPPSEQTVTVTLKVAMSPAEFGYAGAVGDTVEVPADVAQRWIDAGIAEAGSGGRSAQQQRQPTQQPAQQPGQPGQGAGPSGPIRRAPDAEAGPPVHADRDDDDDDKDTPRVPRRR